MTQIYSVLVNHTEQTLFTCVTSQMSFSLICQSAYLLTETTMLYPFGWSLLIKNHMQQFYQNFQNENICLSSKSVLENKCTLVVWICPSHSSIHFVQFYDRREVLKKLNIWCPAALTCGCSWRTLANTLIGSEVTKS